MRILFVPVFNYASALGSDSIYLISGDWCRAVCEADPEISFFRVLPNPGLKDHFRRFAYDYEPVHPRVHDVFTDMFTWYTMEESNNPWEFYRQFHPFFGDLAVDAVVCTSAAKMVHLKPLLTSVVDPKKFQRFFNFELLIRGHGSREVKDVTDNDTLLQATGELMAFNLFQSPMCQRMVTKAARKYVSASMSRRILEQSAMVYSGYDSGQAYVDDEGRNEKFTLILRGRFSPSKNADKVLALYNKFAARHDVRIVATTGGQSFTEIEGLLEQNKAIEFLRLKSKTEANAEMRKAHAFVFWSTHELFAGSVWEMFAAGLIGVIKRSDWLAGLLPDRYPYVFETESEAYSMLVDIHENYEARRADLEWMITYVRAKFAYDRSVPASVRLLREWTDNGTARPARDWLVELMRDKGGASMDIVAMETLVCENSERGKLALARHVFPGRVKASIGPLELVRAALAAGYCEDLESSTIRVEKRDTKLRV